MKPTTTQQKNAHYKRPKILCVWLAFIFTVYSCSVGAEVFTNQQFIQSLNQYDDLDEQNISDVFTRVLLDTPETLIIYPTEGYYYFWFHHQGNTIRGNLRFSFDLVDKGEVSFAYYHHIKGQHRRPSFTHHKIFGEQDGLILKKVGEHRYSLTYTSPRQSKNSATTKPIRKMVVQDIPHSNYQPASDEVLMGTMRDESGVVFSFVYHQKINQFYYILDDSKDYEHYYDISKNVMVGARTGFVYFTHNGRHVLVGISDASATANDVYDGPFDQLPDHTLSQTHFKYYAEKAYPQLSSQLDAYGRFISNTNRRIAIDNYIRYKHLNEFADLKACQHQSLACLQAFIDTKQQTP